MVDWLTGHSQGVGIDMCVAGSQQDLPPAQKLMMCLNLEQSTGAL